MTNEEKIRLVLETLGVDSVKSATKAMKDLAAGIDETYDKMDDLSEFTKEFARSIREGVEKPVEDVYATLSGRKRPDGMGSSDSFRNIFKELFKDTSFEDTDKKLDKLFSYFGKNSKYGRAILESSYLIDDLQYGFRGVVNNIPRIAQSFGIAAGAVGAIGFAVVGVNQALNILWPLIASGEKPVESLKEKLTDFATGMGATRLEAEKFTKEIEKMADKAVPGLFTSVDTSIKKIQELIRAQQELEELKKEQDKRNAAAEAEKQQREKKANTDEEKGKTVKEFLEGMTPDQEAALADKVKKDQLQKGRNDAIAEQLAAMERNRNFSDFTLLGMAVPFINKGGTNLWKSGAEDRAKLRRDEAKAQVEKQIGEGSPETQRFAQMRADELLNKARNGDRGAIQYLTAIDPNMAAFVKETENDEVFDRELAQRSKILDANRKKRDDQLAAEKKAAADHAASLKALDKKMKDTGTIQGQRLDDGTIIGGDVIDDKTSEAAQKLLQKTVGDFKQAEREKTAENKGQAAIRNAILQQVDPLQAALNRRMRVGQSGTGKELAAAEQQDISALTMALNEKGFGLGEAEEAAKQSLTGGEKSFKELAERLGRETDSISEGFSAALTVMQRLQQESFAREARTIQMRQQLEMMGNGDNRAPSRPVMPRRMSR